MKRVSLALCCALLFASPAAAETLTNDTIIQLVKAGIGNDAVITFAGASGNLELNTMIPVIAHNLLQSIELLTNAAREFGRRCVSGLQADAARCAANIEQSLALGTALVPVLGYEKAAAIAKVAHESQRNIREVALELSGLDRPTIERLLQVNQQTEPGRAS